MNWIAVGRERFTGLTWPHLTLLCLVAGAIGGVVAFWWGFGRGYSVVPLLALASGAIVISIAVGLVRLAGTIRGRYDDVPKGR